MGHDEERTRSESFFFFIISTEVFAPAGGRLKRAPACMDRTTTVGVCMYVCTHMFTPAVTSPQLLPHGAILISGIIVPSAHGFISAERRSCVWTDRHKPVQCVVGIYSEGP